MSKSIQGASQKSHPIIMSAPMVRALLDGRKTQTRRIIKPQPEWIESSGRYRWPIPKAQHPGCSTTCVTASREWHEYMPEGCCPYGQPGDLLWVRETYYKREDNTIPIKPMVMNPIRFANGDLPSTCRAGPVA